MKEITFTMNKKTFTLDLIQGELRGEDGETKNYILERVKKYIGIGYAGQYPDPNETVYITNPWHDIYQFAACLFFRGSFPYFFPKELLPYAPKPIDDLSSEEFQSLEDWGVDF